MSERRDCPTCGTSKYYCLKHQKYFDVGSGCKLCWAEHPEKVWPQVSENTL